MTDKSEESSILVLKTDLAIETVVEKLEMIAHELPVDSKKIPEYQQAIDSIRRYKEVTKERIKYGEEMMRN